MRNGETIKNQRTHFNRQVRSKTTVLLLPAHQKPLQSGLNESFSLRVALKTGPFLKSNALTFLRYISFIY